VKRLAAALDRVRASRSRTAKEQALADAFAAIGRRAGSTPAFSPFESIASDDAEGLALATAARLASGRTLPVGDGRPLGVGWALLGGLLLETCGYPSDVVRACVRRCGDLGEAYGLLVARIPGAEARPGVPLVDVARAIDLLASTGSRAGKARVLRELLAGATPLETKYLVKILQLSLRIGAQEGVVYLVKILQLSLRIGAQEGVVEAAIARAFDRDPERVRRALALVGDPGIVAVLARDDRLEDARFAIGRPVAYMLATPLEAVATPLEPSKLVVEDKIDGIRAQVHKRGPDVTIFARGLEQVTGAFPEVAEAFRFVPGDVALDGELVALGPAPERRPRPFQALQTRLNRATATPAMISKTPVTFVAYDLLADGDGAHLDAPWTDRRARLEAFARECGLIDSEGENAGVLPARRPAGSFVLHPFHPLDADPASLDAVLDVAFTAARGRGHEGVVLKRADAPYEAGRRGSAWIKVKRAYATLDVVVTAAEEGHGKRAGVLSDYTFAVWHGDALVNVGKAYSGLTDLEIDAMTRRFLASTVERHGGVRVVRPEVVLEVGFDGVQRSKRHKSGFALRFPRILRIRDDKRPADADHIEAVEALFAAQVESGHREEVAGPLPAELPANGSRARRTERNRPSRAEVDPAQLSLFGAHPKPAR
jgi:DNA ligase-1